MFDNSNSSMAIVLVGVMLVSLMLIPITLTDQQVAHDDDDDNTTISSINKDLSNNNERRLNSMEISVKNNIENDNFTSIFDGRTLEGWKMAGDGKFAIVEEDDSLQSEKGGGLLWYTKKKFDDFVLKLEWKVSDEGDNSGLFVRFPDPEDDPGIAVREGYEIQIDDKAGDAIHKTGAVYDFAAPSNILSKPAGQWNTLEVQVVNQSYTVIINGEKVTKFTGNRLTEGYIGLQAHDDESKVSFRNIMIKEVKS